LVVRVKVRLEYEDKQVEAVALANAGFESDEPEIIVPVDIARELNLYPHLPGGAIIDRYRGAGGRTFKVYRLSRGIVRAYVITEDRLVGPVDVTLTIVPGEYEVILSDQALDSFGIVLVKPGKGLWKFIDDPVDKIRKSASY